MFTDNKEYKTWAYYSLHGVGVFETFPLLQNAIKNNKGQGFSNCYKGFEGLDEAMEDMEVDGDEDEYVSSMLAVRWRGA